MKHFSFLLLVLLTANCFAQNKQLTLDEAVLKGRNVLAPARLEQLSWLPGSNQYVYVANKKLVITDAVSQKADSIEVNSQGLQQYNKGNIPMLNWISKDEFYFKTSQGVYSYRLSSGTFNTWAALPAQSDDVDVEARSHNIAYTLNNTLQVIAGGKTLQVAASEKDGIVYGKAVHRNEFNINKGTFWSPAGNRLAYYRMDESMVATYPIYKLDDKPAWAKLIRYPMAGATSHQVKVMVYDVVAQKNTTLRVTGEPDQYLTNVSWSPDEKWVYIAVVNRVQNHTWLNQYDAVSGAFVKTLFEETSDTYSEPLSPVVFAPDGKSFIWESERDGNNNYYLYSPDGKLVRQLAKEYVALDFLGFDAAGKNIFLQALSKNNIDRICLMVNLATGSSKVVGSDGLTNTPLVSSTGDYVINQESAIDLPRRYELVNTKNGKSSVVFNAPNPLAGYVIGTTELKQLQASDGTPLFARIIKPAGFDATKKYPVVVYVYGGPHAQMVNNVWLGAADMWMYYLANKGYIIFTLDNRGSGNRDRKFKTAPFHHLGDIEMDDQLAGVNYLKSLPYVDAARIGVDGWSYGGFMTVSLMTRQPGVFKVAVAGGPVIDWSYYETMYTERYMGTPQTNVDGYNKNSLFNYIDNINGKMMLIHGTSDDVVLWQQSLLYLQRCVEQGKQVDYMVYPGHLHNVMGKDRVHLIRKITDYFITNL